MGVGSRHGYRSHHIRAVRTSTGAPRLLLRVGLLPQALRLRELLQLLQRVRLDLPYPLALALIAGFLDLIPTVGATIAGVIIAVVALSVSVEALIVFAIVMVVYQQIENYVLQPTIIGKAAQVSGFTVLTSVLVFGALFGLIGAIIGVPIAAALQILVDELTAARRARIAAADAEQPLA